jgi:serine protease Do
VVGLALAVLGSVAAAESTATKASEPTAISFLAPQTVDDLRTIQKQVRTVLEKVQPAVVGVRVGGGSGSGVIISADGYVLTAGHVSGSPDHEARVFLADGREVKAKTLGRNRSIDNGLLKITEEGKYPFVEMGNSSRLKRGQWCITIGHPGGFRTNRTAVVRLGRVLDFDDTLIRTDCTLVGGDSGGPLFDLDSKVIGIHSRIGGVLSANIHVPVDSFRESWDRLVKGESWGTMIGERPTSGYLGVQLDLESDGCKVARVHDDGPAAKAGFKTNDNIVAFDGQKIADTDELTALLRKKKPGDKVTVKVQRARETVTLQVTLGTRPS